MTLERICSLIGELTADENLELATYLWCQLTDEQQEVFCGAHCREAESGEPLSDAAEAGVEAPAGSVLYEWAIVFRSADILYSGVYFRTVKDARAGLKKELKKWRDSPRIMAGFVIVYGPKEGATSEHTNI